MAKRPPSRPGDDDPRVTDLRRYRQEREKAARKPPPKVKPPAAGFLGSNPRAGLILAVVVVLILALYVAPNFL